MSNIPIYPMSDYERQLAIARIEERERELIAQGREVPPILRVAKRYTGTITYIP